MIDILIGIITACLITVLTRAKHALTWPAVLTADAMLLFICCMSSYIEGLFLIGMYLAVFGVDLIFKHKIAKSTGEVHKKGGGRNIFQILANGSAGCVCILLYKITGQTAFLLAYYMSIFEVLADSIASDVGVMSKRQPWDICTWKPVARGLSGGVSVLGLGSSAIACICGGVLTGLALKLPIPQVLAVILVPYCGMLLDSVIGSKMQVKYVCTVCGECTEQKVHCGCETKLHSGFPKMSNGTVNCICTVAAAVGGYLIARTLF